ncbi:MAG: CvpA family protein [bacterium]|nr:CvpA family protein [bacterium]
MNVVDYIILALVIIGFLIGFKRGFTKELVSLVGIFLILFLSFTLKNPISVFLYKNFPFINFGGIFKDITVLNILFYELVAFFTVFLILFVMFKILLKLTSCFEKLLTATIILGIPSKILGGLLGIIHSIIYVFISLYILSLPIISFSYLKSSKLSNIILSKTPVLNVVCDKTLDVFDEIVKLKDEYNFQSSDEFNEKVLNLMIKNNIISRENALILIKDGKIKNIKID